MLAVITVLSCYRGNSRTYSDGAADRAPHAQGAQGSGRVPGHPARRAGRGDRAARLRGHGAAQRRDPGEGRTTQGRVRPAADRGRRAQTAGALMTVELTGEVLVDLPPQRAFTYFTPEG